MRRWLGLVAAATGWALGGAAQEAPGAAVLDEAPGAALQGEGLCRTLGEKALVHLRDSPWEKDRAEFLREPVFCALQAQAWGLALELTEAGLAEAATPLERATFLDLKARALHARNAPGDGPEAAATLHMLRSALEGEPSDEAARLRFFAAMDLVSDRTRSAHPQEGADPEVDEAFAPVLAEAPTDKDRADVYTLWAEVYARSRFLEAPARRARELLDLAEPLLTYDLKPPVLHLRALLGRSLGEYARAREDVEVALISTGPGRLRDELLHLQRLLCAPEVRFTGEVCGNHLCFTVYLRNVEGAELEIHSAKGRLHRESLSGAVDPGGLTRELAWPLPKKARIEDVTRAALSWKGAVLAEWAFTEPPTSQDSRPGAEAIPPAAPLPEEPAAPAPSGGPPPEPQASTPIPMSEK